jgi:ubiquinone/menaquinone biosynthesis C-methylase UbiE
VMRIADMLPVGGEVLEVTSGAGALAIPLARTGRMHITALYVNDMAIDAARRNFEKVGVRIDVHKGNPAHMPFPDGSFDFVICRAPMKQFRDPVGVLREMRRVLKPGRRGVILNLRRDVPHQAVTRYIESQHSSGSSRFFAFLKLRMQQRRAYTLRQFEALLSQVPFGSARIDGTPIGVEVWFER